MAVFSRIGYTRTEARSRLFDVMWAHDYPFGGDLKEMLQHLEPHQKVRMHLPSPPIFLTNPPDLFMLHYNIYLECARLTLPFHLRTFLINACLLNIAMYLLISHTKIKPI